MKNKDKLLRESIFLACMRAIIARFFAPQGFRSHPRP